MLIGVDNDLIQICIHSALSLLIVKCHNLEPAVVNTQLSPSFGPSVRPPTWPPVVPTWGSDFTDLDLVAARRTALRLNAILQRLQHQLLWELGHELQVFDWNVELGPVVGYHPLAGASRNEREREMDEGRSLKRPFNISFNVWKKAKWITVNYKS